MYSAQIEAEIKNSNSKPIDDGKNRGIHPIICKLTIQPTPPVNLRPCCPKPCNAPGWDTSVPAPRSCWLVGQAVFDWSTNMPINRQLYGTGVKVNLFISRFCRTRSSVFRTVTHLLRKEGKGQNTKPGLTSSSQAVWCWQINNLRWFCQLTFIFLFKYKQTILVH